MFIGGGGDVGEVAWVGGRCGGGRGLSLLHQFSDTHKFGQLSSLDGPFGSRFLCLLLQGLACLHAANECHVVGIRRQTNKQKSVPSSVSTKTKKGLGPVSYTHLTLPTRRTV